MMSNFSLHLQDISYRYSITFENENDIMYSSK